MAAPTADTRAQRLPPGITPRLLTADQAAAYCGVSRENFEARVGVPPLKLFGNRVLYDRIALDRWLDKESKLPEISDGGSGVRWEKML